MTRENLERDQVWIYLTAIMIGFGFGSIVPSLATELEIVLWPALGVMIYTTFTQIPLIALPNAFRDRRFMGAILFGNFLIIPLIVGALLMLSPDDPAVRLGILLVLLVPCTDWYLTFTHLGGGDTGLAIAATPLNLLVQLVALPIYLWLFMGDAFLELLAADRIALVFASLIGFPLLAAWMTERWVAGSVKRQRLARNIGLMPVPLLALVIFLIAASQVHIAAAALPVLGEVFGVFVLYLIAAAAAATGLAKVAHLTAASGRALIFSLGTRNSFVVLPLALALDPQWQKATVVIVFQSLVELFGMLVYLWLVPKLLPASRWWVRAS